MRDVLSASHTAVGFVIDGFNGDRIGVRVDWNAGSPQSGRSAEHGPAYGTYPPYIAVSGGTETTPIDKWASVVYEMFNLENSNDFERLFDDATKGAIDANAYAEKCVELEFVAVKKTHEFFKANPLPKNSHRADKWYEWVTASLPSFEEYKSSFNIPGTNSSNSNFAYFKEYYETMIVPYGDIIQRSKR